MFGLRAYLAQPSSLDDLLDMNLVAKSIRFKTKALWGLFLRQLHRRLEQCGVAVQISGRSADALVSGQCLEQMNGRVLVGELGQKCSAARVACSAFHASTGIHQCKGLGQTVSGEAGLETLLAVEEGIVAVDATSFIRICLQFCAELAAHVHGPSDSVFRHVRQ